jgi:hypothetical protein
MATTASTINPSPDRIAEFKDDFLHGRSAFAALEKAFESVGALEHRSDWSSDDAFGFDSVMEATPWLSNSTWGPAPAWDLAIAQERFLLAKFEAALIDAVSKTGRINTELITSSTAKSIVGATDELSALLWGQGFEPQLVVIASSLGVDVLVDFNALLDSPFWKLPKGLQANWLLGADKGRLFLLWPEASERRIYVIDARRFGRLVQFGQDLDLNVTPKPPKMRIQLYEAFRFEIEEPEAVWGAALKA